MLKQPDMDLVIKVGEGGGGGERRVMHLSLGCPMVKYSDMDMVNGEGGGKGR